MQASPPAADRSTASSPGVNLLRWHPFRAIFLWWGFPYVVQLGLLALFLYLAVLGTGRAAPEGVQGKLYAKTNLVNLLIWGLWWPAMVWGAVLLGRAWCAVCPLEIVANFTERLGRGLGVRQRSLGPWVRSGVLILAIYALIQMLVAGAHLHRDPGYTSIFLWALLASAGIVGLAFKDRAFCRGFCPVGLLLGTYGRGSMLVVRPASGRPCETCVDHPCRKETHRARLDARSCPSLLNPAKLNGNSDCLVCGQCVKACQPMDNMSLYLRRPFHPADAREAKATWPATLFVMLVSGFVAYELCSEWGAAKNAFLWPPTAVTDWLGATPYAGWIRGAWMLFVLPAILWLLLGAVVFAARRGGSMLGGWRRLALPLVAVISAGHMAKALAKIVSWGGYLPMALENPTGTENALAITSGAISPPGPLLPMKVVSVIGLMVLLVMSGYALRESRLADPDTHRSRVPAILLVAGVSCFLVFGWGFLR